MIYLAVVFVLNLAQAAHANQACVGTIEIGNVPVCAGFVSGPSEITTALHCVSFLQPEDWPQISFENRFGQTSYYLSTQMVDEARDLIVMRMSGAEHWPALDRYSPPTSDSAMAFGWDDSNGKKLIPVALNVIPADSAGMLKYALFSIKIASGSPVIQGNHALGVHLGRSKSPGDSQKDFGEAVSLNPEYVPIAVGDRFLFGDLKPDSDVFCVKTVLGLVTVTAACAAGIAGLSVACALAPVSCPGVFAVAKLCGVGVGALGAAVIACAVK